MLENLEKARVAKAANRKNVTKYPVKKRERAVEMYKEDIETKANALAEKKARELAEKLIREEKEREELEISRNGRRVNRPQKNRRQKLQQNPRKHQQRRKMRL